MAAKWVEKLQTKLAANPLYWIEGEQGQSRTRCAICFAKSTDGATKGHKVALYMVTNYNEFRTCDMCKTVYR